MKDRFGIKDDPTMENKDATKNEKQSDRSTEKHTDNTDNTVTETSENTEEVTTENIDEAIEPAASSDAEKQPEISKSALKKEVSDAWNAFKKVSEGIDSSISMFTKDDKTILDDGKKLDVAYKKVMESLQKIPQLFSEDAEMQEFSREMMVNLSEYYSDRGVDNDHHTDPTKAVQLLLPAVTNLADKA